jgi:hypothetical protein
MPFNFTRAGKRLSWFIVAVLIAYVSDVIAVGFMFPFGGGEFHAMFAYTHEGHLAPAVLAYVTSTWTLAACAALLVLLRFPLRWTGVALACTLVGVAHWWEVCTWEPQSDPFHAAVLALIPGIPLTIFGASCLAARVSERWVGRAGKRAAAQ